MKNFGVCFVCNKRMPLEYLSAEKIFSRSIFVCKSCRGMLLSYGGPTIESAFGGYLKKAKKAKAQRLREKIDLLKKGKYPSIEEIVRDATLLDNDPATLLARLQGLPMWEKLKVLTAHCGQNIYEACATVRDGVLRRSVACTVDTTEMVRKILQKECGITGGLVNKALSGVSCFLYVYHEAEKSREAALRAKEAKRRERENGLKCLSLLLADLPGWNAHVAENFYCYLEREARKPVSEYARGAKSEIKQKELAGKILKLLNCAQPAEQDPGLSAEAKGELLTFLREYVGWKKLDVWFAAAAASGYTHFTKKALQKEKEAEKREKRAEARREEARRAHEERIKKEKEMVRALRYRLTELGVNDPITYDSYRHLLKMLPEEKADALKLKTMYEIIGFGNSEPAWVREPADPEAVKEHRRLVSDEALLAAWNDRWITIGTAADELGVSENRIRNLLDHLTVIEVENPHYKSAPPMKLIRLSSLQSWAEKHEEEVKKWAEASKRAKEAYRRVFARKVDELRSFPAKIEEATKDPAPLVCFWLSLLNRAAKTGHPHLYDMKDNALKMLVRTGVPFTLNYIEGGDREEKVWLCDSCLEEAREMDMSPPEYIEVCGPCKNCDVEPAVPRYYDLYELTFSFPGIGKFSYHVPYEKGVRYLPRPENISEDAVRDRGEEEGFTFGRSLNKIERAAFTVDEIREGLLAAMGKFCNQRIA